MSTIIAAERPFVHLFTTDGAKYVYDVNTAAVAQVDELNWAILSNWEKQDGQIASLSGGRHSPDEVSAARRFIIETGESGTLFSPRRPSAVRSMYTREAAEERLARHCHQLVLNVSERCNLRCKYCYFTSGREAERTHSERMMTWETAEKAIHFYLDHSSGEYDAWRRQQERIARGEKLKGRRIARLCIGFYGGEPLTNWPLMKRATSYIRGLQHGGDYLVNCTVNGTLLTPEVMHFMADHDVSLSVSCDGPRDYHDRYRRDAAGGPTWERVCANLRYMSENLPRYYKEYVSVIGVMAPPSDLHELLRFAENWDLMPGHGIRFNGLDRESPECFWGPLAPEEREIEGNELWWEYVEAAVEGKNDPRYVPADEKEFRRLTFLRNLFSLTIAYAYTRTQMLEYKEDTVPDVYLTNWGMCLPGLSRIFVTVDGDILPCERLPSRAPAFRVGNIDSGFDMDAVMAVAEGNAAMTAEECRECWNVRMCQIPCSKIVGPDGRLSREAKLKACEGAKMRTELALGSMCTILERNPDALRFLDEM